MQMLKVGPLALLLIGDWSAVLLSLQKPNRAQSKR